MIGACRSRVLTGLALAGLWTGVPWMPAVAQAVDTSAGTFDCVIEPRAVVELGSTEEGIIREILVDRGDIVRQGDVVARLDSELEALAVEAAKLQVDRDIEVLAGRARLEYRQRELNRVNKLFGKKIVSNKERDEAAVERRLADYGLKAAEADRLMVAIDLKNAQSRLDRRMLSSPIDGVVVEITMAVGEFAHEQSPIMTLAQIHPLNVEVYMPISHFGSVEIGMPAKVIPEEPIGGAYLARVNVLDRVFDTASSTFGVRLVLQNPDYAVPAGVKCTVRFLSGGNPAGTNLINEPEQIEAAPSSATNQ